jgi:hypothetical protein
VPKTDQAVYTEPSLPSLPEAGGKFCDPTFNSEIMRVTDSGDSQSNGTYYSYWPTFNSNNTRLLVRINNSGATYTLNPTTFTLGAKQSIPGLPNFGGSFIAESAIWSATDPDVLYGGGWSAPKLWALNVATGTYTLVRDFSNVAGVSASDHLFHMSMSDPDDDVFAFIRQNSSGQNVGYIVYRRSTNTIIRNVAPFSINGVSINEIQIDKSGRYLTIAPNGSTFYVHDLLTGAEDTLLDAGGGNPSLVHADTGTRNMVGWDRWDNRILYRNLGDLQTPRAILSQGSDWTQAKHTSMRAVNEGWVLVSFFSESTSDPRNGVFHNELVQIATDGSQRVRRLVHHRSVYHSYWDAPRANISRDGRFVAFSSTWGDTGRDDLFIARIQPATSPSAENVTWTNKVGVTASGNDLTKTSTVAGWNAGAISSQTLTGDGYVEFSTAENDVGKMCGLSHTSANQNYTEIDYAISLGGGNLLRVYENGVLKAGFGNYTPGQRFRVAVEGGVVKYYRDGMLFYTSTVAPVFPLLVDSSLYATGATITDAVIFNQRDVTWTNKVGVTASGNDLTKTSTVFGWNAGATSSQTLTGDGYVEFSTGEISTGKVCGLSQTSANQTFTEIDYGLSLGGGNLVRVYENGVLKTTFGSYVPGERYRVAVEGGVVKYYKEGELFYTSDVPPSSPLLVDSSLQAHGATITDAVISGAWSN